MSSSGTASPASNKRSLFGTLLVMAGVTCLLLLTISVLILAWLGPERASKVREGSADGFTDMMVNGGTTPTQQETQEKRTAIRNAVLPRNRQIFDIGPTWFAWAKTEDSCILPDAPLGAEYDQEFDLNFYLMRSPTGVQSVRIHVYQRGQMTPKGRCGG